MALPLFHRLMGAPFESLAPLLRSIHGGGTKTYLGRCEVIRGTGLLSRLCAAVASLPPAGASVPLSVSITSHARGEIWDRSFDGKRMRSALSDRDGFLEERLGPSVFRFTLAGSPEAIEWKLVGVRSFGVPLPLAWFDKVRALESLDGGRYRFDVRAELPIAGLLVHYRGTLDAAA
jgi:hypothetical protein